MVEETDESLFWMEILIDANIIPAQQIEPLIKEATEILKVVASARKKVSQVKK